MMNDSLGDRMKSYYEEVSKTRLTRRTPVIIRLDGKAFHTFTRGFKKPFDQIMAKTMQDTMKYLCENIQGCVLGYTQSDEITLVLQDYKELMTDAWFDYEVQKMCSISAAMATLAFNKSYIDNVAELVEDEEQFKKYSQKFYKAMFDSRCFNIPKEEVCNCVLWRQFDAERNSILSVGQANYSQKELQGLNVKQVKAKLELEKGIIWGNLPTPQKRGTCCVKEVKYFLDGQEVKNGDIIEYNNKRGSFYKDGEKFYFSYVTSVDWHGVDIQSTELEVKETSKWVLDYNIPRFIDDGRKYIENLINIEE